MLQNQIEEKVLFENYLFFFIMQHVTYSMRENNQSTVISYVIWIFKRVKLPESLTPLLASPG